MKKKHLLKIVILILLSVNVNVIYGDSLNVKTSETVFKKHSICLNMSYLNRKNGGVVVQTGPYTIDAGIGGIGGKIIYNYYPNYNYSFFFSIGGSSPEVKVHTFSNYSSSVISFVMGVRYFLLQFPEEDFLRPYVAGGMQMLIGTESEVHILNIGTHTESAMGAYGGFGTELLLNSWLKFNIEMGYNAVTDFVESIGSQKNYSGFEFSFGLGVMF